MSSGMLYYHIDIFFGHGLGQGQVVGCCVCDNELVFCNLQGIFWPTE